MAIMATEEPVVSTQKGDYEKFIMYIKAKEGEESESKWYMLSTRIGQKNQKFYKYNGAWYPLEEWS